MPKLTFFKEPYFDDFDKANNYMRVLFRPRRSIQVRELNQIQSIFNNQIEEFADHIFKFGSRVDAGSVRYENSVDYVRLKDLDIYGENVSIDYLQDKKLKGNTSGVTATVKHVEDKTIDDPYTIYVNYTGAGTDGETITFIEGEQVNVLDSNGNTIYSFYVRCLNCDTNSDEDTILPTGKGSLFSVSESTYYVYGYFVFCDQQTIVLEKYDVTPTSQVGLMINQTIISEAEDETLYDNALGSANYAAPGSDRYKISLELIKQDIETEDNENFINLGSVRDGILLEIVNRPQYADIMDMIARRTYDESGDYTVTPFIVTPKEHLKSSSTDTTGYLTASDGGDEAKIAAFLSPGKAYVKGYEIEKISQSVVPMDKARDTDKRASAITRKKFGNYILVQLNSNSNFIPSGSSTTGDGRKRRVFDFTTLDIYDATVSNLSSAGNIIGTLKVKGMELYEKNVTFTDSVWKLNVVDVQMDAGKTFQGDAIGLLASGMDGSTAFGCNMVQDTYIFNDNQIRIFETGENSLLYKLPYEYVKSVRDINNNTESRTMITTPVKYYGQSDVNGTVRFVARGDETFTSFNAATWFLGHLNTNNWEPTEIVSTDISVTNTYVEIANLTAYEDYFLVAEAIISNQPEKTKTLTTLIIGADGSIPADVTSISLTKADAYDLLKVEQWDSGSYATYELALASSAVTDVTDNYTLDMKIKDNYYDISVIDLNSGVTVPTAGQVVQITFDYFLHGNITDGAYFSVDSYEPTINDPNRTFTYEDIPSYITKDGVTYNLTDTLDFRPIKQSGGDFEGVDYIPSNNKNIIFDIEYYLSRRDLLVITENGDFDQVKGESSLDPKYPKTPDNSMVIYKVDMDPYTFDPLINAKFKYVDNRRYTMKDIGEFNDRIKNLQYYVSLNLLDQELETMQLVDSSGNDRYKNGFLTDPFNNLRSGDVGSNEYRCAIDPEKGELRPQFNKKVIKLAIDEVNSTNYQITSNMVTLPYTNEVYVNQSYASKSLSVNPYFITSTEGQMTLSPSNDVWNDTETLPDLVVNVDTGFEALREIVDATGLLGTVWNTVKREESVIKQGPVKTKTSNIIGMLATTTSRTDTVRVSESQTGLKTDLTKNISNNSLGEYVTDVQLLTYIRTQDVQFYASGLPKNMKMYAFFDDVDVNDNVRPLNGSFGEQLKTDSNGTVVGVFRIPNENGKRFYVGTKKLRLTNSSTNSTDSDVLRGYAEADYHAGGLKQTKQETVLSVATPEITKEVINRTSTTTERRNIILSRSLDIIGGGDPLAQSFYVNDDSGFFITKLDLYFETKGSIDGVWLELREMINGYPGQNMLPYGRVRVSLDDIKTSDDGSIATTFSFEAPVYLQGNTEYCFVLGSDDKENRIFASKLGGKDLITGSIISTQPHMGSLFKSQNNRTWNAEQYEDFKFTMYRAKFDISSNLSFVAESDENSLYQLLQTNPIETESGSNVIRIHHKNHGFTAGDKVKLNMVSDNWFDFVLQSGNIVAGQTITGTVNGGTAIVKNVQYISGTNYKVQVLDLTGYFDNAEVINGSIYYEDYNSSAAEKHGITIDETGHLNAVGYFTNGIDNTFNNIPISELAKDLTITAVDTIDSYILTVTTNANVTGRIGGDGIYVKSHAVGDAITIQGNVIDFNGSGNWTYDSVMHKGIGSTLTDYSDITDQGIILNQVTELTQPIKVANDTNAILKNSGVNTFVVTGSFNSNTDYLSPVINLDTFSAEIISNRIEWNNATNMDVSPNILSDDGTVVSDVAINSGGSGYVVGDVLTLTTGNTSGVTILVTEVDGTGVITNIKLTYGGWGETSETGVASVGGTGSSATFNTTVGLTAGVNGKYRYETDNQDGTCKAKYLTKVVNLENPANVITIYADVVNYNTSDIDFYYRVVSADSETPIGEIDWIETNITLPVSDNGDDFKEIEINIPSNNPLLPEAELEDFRAFQVKIVMRSKNSAKSPKVKRLRCIATT